jgi:uncharacterized membrane protein
LGVAFDFFVASVSLLVVSLALGGAVLVAVVAPRADDVGHSHHLASAVYYVVVDYS